MKKDADSLKKDVVILNYALEKEKTEKRALQDYQSLVAARGLVEKVEQHFFDKQTHITRQKKWELIGKDAKYQELHKILEPCEIADISVFIRDFYSGASGLIHNLNLVKVFEPPSFFGPKNSCFYLKLKEFCDLKGIPLTNPEFYVDLFQAVLEDIEKNWEDEGNFTISRNAFSFALGKQEWGEAADADVVKKCH